MRPQILNPLFSDTTALTGIGPKIAALINRTAGPRIVDVLMTAPTALIDRTYRPKIADAKLGILSTVTVTIDSHEAPPKGARRLPYKVICSDDTGFLTLIFFHARGDYLEKTIPVGSTRIISGKIEDYNGARQMAHPDYMADPDKPQEMPLHEPVYPLTAGLTGAVMRKAAIGALARAPSLDEWQDPTWRDKNQWVSWQDAIQSLHAPSSLDDLSLNAPARQRLAYDELLANQLALMLSRRGRVKSKGRKIEYKGALLAKAKTAIPFELTNAQRRTLKEIFADMKSPERMIRLVQGDVGSGKTIIAFLAMLAAIESGAQTVLMAPTEILARQHYDSLSELAETVGITMETLSGRDKGKSRREKLARLANGEIDMLIGTHAVFQDDVSYKDIALVVIDEQHRFGVHQRIALTQKGPKPDLLVMTATPIPRTLALTAYGDMEASAIDEKPPGRKPIETRAVPLARIDDVISGLTRVMERGEQAYWVCPLVEESDLLDLTAAEERFESVKAVLGDRVGLVHGRMSAAEKDAVMEKFYLGELSVLIATTVIEVGVNAPNATIMIIENAERFGLAQLHQLRGRVGRGDKSSSCILLYKPPLGETATARLNILRQTEDGFLIAEEDLRLRGAGDLLGAAQSGFPVFRFADTNAHGDLLLAARDDAKLIMENDPALKSTRGEALRTLLYLFARDDAIKLLDAG